ncbi:carboxypeptidase-like regulatory domain-containing protein [Flavobacterium sp. J49]|uniref:carboxypeptidase-like regulatory domain-containing protein n=1 Tax=Flavobacterium sp. J49 TaxID=2718534 RepID=UPI0015945DD7|nr:carboxypeptidase-like regulatory domain-containing protein [Flavobacterium sp. J49]MBF6642034.1 carboxypeptidase-like regulatory domain-containing protein [Flavobacterium sp. J49]NIC03282.1 hypothetical protein [Flavobacterium sp. J49]
MTKINISIPQPCHENWDRMTAVDKGRFCASCQKKVHDFTKASDREIVTAFQQNQNLCGRFLNSQLDRDLVKPKEKSPIWLATTATIVSLIGIGTHEVTAQEPVKTEQTDNRMLGKFIITPKSEEVKVSGIVKDSTGPLPGAVVLIKGSNTFTQTDIDGKFTIKAKKGDTLVFNYVGYGSEEIIVNNTETEIIEIKILEAYTGLIEIKRTFFGRIFHSIGNWFR